VRLAIVTDRHADALTVPKRALEREGDRRHVLGVRDGIVRRIDVEEGFSDEDFVEVRSSSGASLAAGDLVIVVGGRDLHDGDAVLVDEEAPAPETAETDAEAH
jgi:hypothetical protein